MFYLVAFCGLILTIYAALCVGRYVVHPVLTKYPTNTVVFFAMLALWMACVFVLVALLSAILMVVP